MSVTSYASVKINVQGAIQYGQTLDGVSNTTSQFQNKLVDVTTTGVQVLTGAPSNQSCIIIPPVGNTNILEVRASVAATTGIALHTTIPTLLALSTTMTQVALFGVSVAISNVRVILF